MSGSVRVPAACVALVLTACGGERVCNDSIGSIIGYSASPGSSATLGEGQAVRQRFTATLSGLPRLWPPDSAIVHGKLELTLSMSYQDGAVSNGHTEMPRVRVGVRTYELKQLGDTTHFPDRPHFETPLFELCENGITSACCRFGEPSCTVSGALELDRLDGSPYPPLNTNWSARALANVAQCPFGTGTEPTVTLSLEGLD